MSIFDIFKRKKDNCETKETVNNSETIKDSNNNNDQFSEMRERLLSAFKEKTKTKSYHIDITEITDGDIFMSKFGGLGYWDNSREYPKDKDGNQLVLLAQINFDRDKFDSPLLPTSGLLQFYILPNDLYGANFDDLLNDGSYKVVLHKNVNYDVRREDLSNIKTSVTLNEDDYFPLTKEFKISFKETYDYINPQDARFRDILDNVVNEEFSIDVKDVPLYRVFGKGIMDYLYDNLCSSGSKLLGCPYFTQLDPHENDKYKKYDILLFQMDSDYKAGILWGKVGIANFFIKDNNNLEDVLYTWDCE